jgi:hypothetical protein
VTAEKTRSIGALSSITVGGGSGSGQIVISWSGQ